MSQDPALEDCQDAGHVALGDEPLIPAQQRGLDGCEQGRHKSAPRPNVEADGDGRATRRDDV